jgi:hypothetical protein
MIELMFVGLTQIQNDMGAFAAGFDPALVTVSEAAQLTKQAAAIEKMAATVKGLAAARAAECEELWRRQGARSAAEQLARDTGTSVPQAIETLKTAERLAELPETAAAARRGELSPAQTAAIADAASAKPGAEAGLLDDAKRLPLRELQKRCSEVKTEGEDPEVRRRRIHDGRYLRDFTDAEGAGNLRMRDNPEVIAAIVAVVGAVRDRLFAKARAEGRREPAEAYGADALHQIVCNGEGAKVSPKVIIRVDLPAYLRGYPLDGEVCEVAGCPVAVSVIDELLESGSPFLAAVVTAGTKLTGVVHFGRRPTAAHQTGLEWIYPTCAVAGCSQKARLQRDHRIDWARTHTTVFDLLDLLCPHHHGLKTTEGWALVHGRGKRDFVAPDDPRHPQHAPPEAA